MPTFFGGLPYPLPPVRYGDTDHLSFSYQTDGDLLARLLPPGFTLPRPELVISLINNRCVEWLAGGAYNLLAVNVPVRFTGQQDDIEGMFGLVVWENATAPILMGRELQGVPKLYANVDDLREFPENALASSAHLNGIRFARVSATLGAEANHEELALLRQGMSHTNWFGWRHFPNVGSPGAALSHPVLFPQEFTITTARLGDATIEWNVPGWLDNPTQIPIIDTLSRLPNLGGGKAVYMQCENVLRADLARIPT
jgi:acetoacetate decarboxylase